MSLKGNKVIVRWLHMGMSVAFNSLCDNFAEQWRMRIVCAKVMLRILNMQLSSALKQWTEWSLDERRMRCKAVKIVLRWGRMSMASAVQKWRENVELCQHMITSAAKAANTFLYRATAAAFKTWQGILSNVLDNAESWTE